MTTTIYWLIVFAFCGYIVLYYLPINMNNLSKHILIRKLYLQEELKIHKKERKKYKKTLQSYLHKIMESFTEEEVRKKLEKVKFQNGTEIIVDNDNVYYFENHEFIAKNTKTNKTQNLTEELQDFIKNKLDKEIQKEYTLITEMLKAIDILIAYTEKKLEEQEKALEEIEKTTNKKNTHI